MENIFCKVFGQDGIQIMLGYRTPVYVDDCLLIDHDPGPVMEERKNT